MIIRSTKSGVTYIDFEGRGSDFAFECGPQVIADYDEDGTLVGVEIHSPVQADTKVQVNYAGPR